MSAEAWMLDIATAELEPDELDPTTILAGTPTTASKELWSSADGTFSHGIWEITPGTVTDVEADEAFTVLTGSATIAFEDGPTLEITPGSFVRLHAGQRTVWTIHETLRKVYTTLSR